MSRRINSSTSSFVPTEIYIESGISQSKITQRILNKFPNVPRHTVSDISEIKHPENHTEAKKRFFLNRLKGELIKQCQGQGDVCCQYFTIDLITNCFLECTYCILQDYLKNNPIITIHTNIDEILNAVQKRVAKEPNRIFRIGAGELSDSLALDHITEFSKECFELANKTPNIVFEFKTKTGNITHLLEQKHNGNIVMGWSLNPQKYIDTEEHKAASLDERLHAAKLCANKGYPIAFHFDPLLNFSDWKQEYTTVIQKLGDLFKKEDIAWISIGSLRFTPGLKKITESRFSTSCIMCGELYPMPDGKIRYFRPIREEMYAYLVPLLTKTLGKIPHYLCMETPEIWQKVFGFTPTIEEVEKKVAEKFLG